MDLTGPCPYAGEVKDASPTADALTASRVNLPLRMSCICFHNHRRHARSLEDACSLNHSPFWIRTNVVGDSGGYALFHDCTFVDNVQVVLGCALVSHVESRPRTC
jgi:hypothetical protein